MRQGTPFAAQALEGGTGLTMTIDERIEALTMHLELLARDHEDTNKRVLTLLRVVEQDAANIRGLARIAEAHF